MSGMAALRTAALVCLLAGVFPLTGADQVAECSLSDYGVYVSISSEMDTVDGIGTRWLIVNWFGHDVQERDFVQLVDTHTQTTLISLEVIEPDGWFMSNVSWDVSLIPDNLDNVSELCLQYRANYVRNEVVLYTSCLTLRPRWMELLETDLWNTSLTEVVLPGTHDAGASTHNGVIAENVVGRWTFTQDESLWQQLVIGARYLDMRIGYYDNLEEKFYVNHGEIVIAPLQRYIDDVVAFMNQTKEIVIFDIHSLNDAFSGHPERHMELIALLESSFRTWMASSTLAPNPTMGDLWRDGGRMIVTYPSSESSSSDYLWPSVYHLWANANNLDDLEAFLYTGIPQQMNRGSLWSAMGELTPKATDVVINRWGGLRGAASKTNFPVTNWLRQDWWNQVNIIAMDFLPYSDVVAVSVAANKLRKQCPSIKKDVSSKVKRWWSIFKSHTRGIAHDAEVSSEERVWLWVSALVSTSPEERKIQRRLEINWKVAEVLEGDWVAIFDHDPQDDWSFPMDAYTPGVTSGYHLTNHSLPPLPVHTYLQESSCLGWWAAYMRDGVPLVTDCIKVHPRWMTSLKAELGDVPLRQLVLPGVHDAGAYTPYDLAADKTLMNSFITQDESIYRQLVYGNRYVDLRVGYIAQDRKAPYWVVSGMSVWRPFLEALQEVRSFVEETGEVVVVEVSGFTFFETPEHHLGCISLISEELAGLMAPSIHTWDAPLRSLLNTDASLVVVYDHPAADGHLLLWSGVTRRSGNVQTLDELQEYMVRLFEVDGPPSLPWNLILQVTPQAGDAAKDAPGGVRAMADKVNRHVTRWLRDEWWNKISIITCDYVLSAGYVEVAIEANQRRASLSRASSSIGY